MHNGAIPAIPTRIRIMKEKLKQLLGFLFLSFLITVFVVFFYYSLNRTADIIENIPLWKKEASLSKITGSVSVYRTDEGNMSIKLSAESVEGEVTKMMVWTDSSHNDQWQPMLSFIEMPVSDFVYARFQDEFGNLSEIYSDSIHPSQGPPDAPNY